MRALGGYLLQGRLQAVIGISFLTVVTMFIPPLSHLLSGVPVGLLILRKGPAYGMQVLLICLLAVVFLVGLLGVAPQMVAAFTLSIWGPVFLCCSALRYTQSQGWMVFAAGMVATACILVVHWLIADVPAWWQQWIELWINTAFPDGGGEQYQEVLIRLVPVMNAIMASAIVTSLVVTTLLSRWWQSVLFNPGGFRPEFYALRLPRAVVFLSLAGLILLFASGNQQGSAGLDILVIVIFMYVFQGLASVHRIVNARKLPQAWLVVMYILLFFLPQVCLMIAVLGLLDSWINIKINRPGDRDRDNDQS